MKTSFVLVAGVSSGLGYAAAKLRAANGYRRISPAKRLRVSGISSRLRRYVPVHWARTAF